MTSTGTTTPSLLVAIASHGRKQDHFLAQAVAALRQTRFPTRILVMSNEDKPVDGAEVVVGLPSRDPYSLPFAHRTHFARHADRHDLFLYMEDDMLITERHIDAFLRAQARLEADEIAGFIRSEVSPHGARFITSIHHHFHWRTETVVERGGELFAQLSNEHSGCFLATQAQLRRAIASGGFLVPPHAETYGMLETAASDIYRQCGLTRLLSLSHIEEFVIPHLPNKYYTFLGMPDAQLPVQVSALRDIHTRGGWKGRLVEPTTRAPAFRWSMCLFEGPDLEVLEQVPRAARRILSIGSGSGIAEAWLRDRGHDVTAVALDAVFDALVQARGIRTVVGPLDHALEALEPGSFDVVLLADWLHLASGPVDVLRRVAPLLAPDGRVIASVANTLEIVSRIGDIARGRHRPFADRFRAHGVHPVSVRRLRRWCRAAGLAPMMITPLVEGRRAALRRRGVRAFDSLLASRFLLAASRTG